MQVLDGSAMEFLVGKTGHAGFDWKGDADIYEKQVDTIMNHVDAFSFSSVEWKSHSFRVEASG